MNIKNLFFENDEISSKGVNTKTKEQPQVVGSLATNMAVPLSVQSQQPQQVQPLMVGVADDRFISMLNEAIEKANLTGLDYLEFKQTIVKMSNLAIDERTKFLSAYPSFEIQGCTKEMLISSIDTYINVVNNEKAAFNAELTDKFKTEVSNKHEQIEKNQQEISRLNELIISLNTENVKLGQEANQSEMNLKMAESNFNQSAQTVISNMENDKQKLITFIV